MSNYADVQNLTGRQIVFDLFPPSKFEIQRGNQPAWYARIALHLNINSERAKKLSRNDVQPNGAEIKIYHLVVSGKISLETLIDQDIKRMEAKYATYL